jgi:hypothetical protein
MNTAQLNSISLWLPQFGTAAPRYSQLAGDWLVNWHIALRCLVGDLRSITYWLHLRLIYNTLVDPEFGANLMAKRVGNVQITLLELSVYCPSAIGL